jgi:hypothetical protein
MRNLLVLFVLTTFVSCGEADANPNADRNTIKSAQPTRLPSEIGDAIAQWSQCRATKILSLVHTARGNEAVVDEAFKECTEFELATRKLMVKHYGAASSAQLQNIRSRWRQEAVTNVREMRAGKALSGGPAHLWGICVGNKLPDPVPNDALPESIVDAAMEACSPEMESVRASYVKQLGAAEAANQVEQLRQQIRRFAIGLVEQKRLSR